MKKVDLVIIGGGPAGMAAAISAKENGIDDILILERDGLLGGILGQCIHNGFGLHRFGEELTGPEYAFRFEKKVKELGISYKLGAMVTDLSKDRVITYVSEEDGKTKIKAGAIILAMGCRERPRGALNTPGNRPSGIYTAGTAQRFVNIKGYLPGKKAVILGSGDIGLIMARRMTLEGCEVKAVVEIMPYSGGLKRNIVQCLNDFNIPLLLSHTVSEIHGKERLTGVTVSQVDENKNTIPGTEKFYECDTLLLSCGLLPENELSIKCGIDIDRITGGAIVDNHRETSVPGIFSCGNVLHVHDLVDFVSEEAELAGKFASDFLKHKQIKSKNDVKVKAKGAVRYTVPQHISLSDEDVKIFFRVGEIIKGARITVSAGDKIIVSKKKPKVAPGEMENVIIKAKDLCELEINEIEVKCEKEANDD